MENALTASSTSTSFDYEVAQSKVTRKSFSTENNSNNISSAANNSGMPALSSTQNVSIGQISEGSSFPHKLYGMLDVETAKVESCACGSVQWEKHGLTFRILDASRFEAENYSPISYFKRESNSFNFVLTFPFFLT